MDKLFGDRMVVERPGYSGMNPFENFQAAHKYQSMPYQFPPSAGGNIHQNPFIQAGNFDPPISIDNGHQGYELKFGSGSDYGHTAVETQSHYGPPQMHSKGGKLKGAALSALTLLAFLFFLNLLQSCLKDQMDAMNPTVSACANTTRVTFNHRLLFRSW